MAIWFLKCGLKLKEIDSRIRQTQWNSIELGKVAGMENFLRIYVKILSFYQNVC